MNSPFDNLLVYLPLGIPAVALLIGMVFAVVRWQHHPSVSLLTLLGCGVLLLNQFAATALHGWIWRSREEHGWTMQQAAFYLSVLGWCRVSFSAVGIGLLLGAVFGWRRRQRFAPTYGPRYDEPRFGDAQPGRRSDDRGETERGRPEEIRKPRE